MGSHSPLREEKVELRGVCQGLTQKVHLTGHHHQIGDWFRRRCIFGMAHRFFYKAYCFLPLNSILTRQMLRLTGFIGHSRSRPKYFCLQLILSPFIKTRSVCSHAALFQSLGTEGRMMGLPGCLLEKSINIFVVCFFVITDHEFYLFHSV